MSIRNATGGSNPSEQDAWYLVQCKSRQDQRAEENLLRQGYVCSRPICLRDQIVRGRRQLVRESLFPGYLFINLPASVDWSPLRSTRGVSRLVSFGGMPLAVGAGVVAQFQQCAELVVSPSFKNGDIVKVLEEGFAELNAVFLTLDGEERAILLIDFLSRRQQVSLPLTKISAL
ncbi:transcription/translation regulatory transformer protein RfaH [Pseudomonas umsongensis]|uniref:transcription/translation regulatory transformer protein RfaH n=1 Tax=Pseudomonas umsongensis TaxID=198618 RepID=UPI00200A2EB8|nr:transcription/translation regulatory transformer protein RfaH [Pseudomonas umsongensis]MCK8683740.1 transcription/translation regulatory transformer protein RfaH [Pseudomonas umsongensis]